MGIPGFKDCIAADVASTFLNLGEFAEPRTIRYDGACFQDIPVVLEGPAEEDREQLKDDHVQGLHLVSAVLHCAAADLGGKLPEQGKSLQINEREGGGGFFQRFYVAASIHEMGMLRVELEAVDE